MKKLLLLTVVAALPLGLMAQDDDMYFVPTKENVAKETKNYGMPKKTYYSGSNRSVDEYNRSAWSSVVPIDSAGNDIIDFSAVRGVYPDSTYVEATDDYKYTKRLSRFEGYTASDAYWEGYRDGRWTSPWYYSSYYPWYDSWYYWNDPWYLVFALVLWWILSPLEILGMVWTEILCSRTLSPRSGAPIPHQSPCNDR